MTEPGFSFRPMTEADVPTLQEWRARPHVAEHWGLPPTDEEVAEKLVRWMDDPRAARPYIAVRDGMEVGFLQVYTAVETEEGWWPGQHDPGVKGVDLFLADGARLNQGLGTEMVRAFTDFLFRDAGTHRIQIDPAPTNHRAIRCYEKAGFRRVAEITTPDGAALLMWLERPPLGLARSTVVVRPWDSRWPELFREEEARIRKALGPSALAVHHVGSTAVVGLAAKPVLDILVSVAAFAVGPISVPKLEALGYEFRPEEDVPDRHYFGKRYRDATGRYVSTHHLSMCEPGSRQHHLQLAFRDALRTDESLRDAYAAIKIRLARKHPTDREAYIRGKADFIRTVIEERGI